MQEIQNKAGEQMLQRQLDILPKETLLKETLSEIMETLETKETHITETKEASPPPTETPPPPPLTTINTATTTIITNAARQETSETPDSMSVEEDSKPETRAIIG